jgi:hypothetical protein
MRSKKTFFPLRENLGFVPKPFTRRKPVEKNRTLDFGEWASIYRTWLARQAEK